MKLSKQWALAVAFVAGSATLMVNRTQAHITLETGEARIGSYYKGVLKVPHGCDGSATRSVRVQIPEGVIGFKPMPKAGWTVATTNGAYARTYQNHGKTVTEGVKEVVWSGGELSDSHYDEFVFTALLTNDLASAEQVYFPTVQTCAQGEARWTEIAAPGQNAHDLKFPAPGLRLVSDTKTVAQAASGVDKYKAGDLTVSAPWSRATPGGAKIAGGYLKITNTGTSPDRLVSAATVAAGRVEIHEMSMTNGVMQMRPLAEGLTIKPGETVELKPGGLHIMFMDLTQPFKQGDFVKATLQFEKAGKLEVSFSIAAIGATSGGGDDGHKHH